MDGRWSISGLASMGAHGALVVGSLWWGAQHPAAVRASGVTELEVHSAPAAIAPAPAPQPVANAVPAQPRRARRVRPPPVSVSTSREEPAPTTPESALPEGDEDHTLDVPSPSTLAAVHVAPPAPLAPPVPPTVTALEASYLCTHQKLRSLPKALDVRGQTYRVQVQACISAEGRVERLTLQQGAAPELDWQVLSDMRAWRYRPRMVQGKPSPFCYKVRVSYEVR